MDFCSGAGSMSCPGHFQGIQHSAQLLQRREGTEGCRGTEQLQRALKPPELFVPQQNIPGTPSLQPPGAAQGINPFSPAQAPF